MALMQGNQGQSAKATGANQTAGMGEFTDVIVTELMPRYYQNTYRGFKFSASVGGAGQTLVAANLFSTAIATFQPILALYNPLTNNKNFVIDMAWCGVIADTLATAAQTGGFYFVGSAGQTITTAASATPVNNLTLKASGSTGVVILNAVLAGAVGNPTLIRPVSASISQVTATANASAIISPMIMEEVGGSLIVPPGGYIGFANGISATVGVVGAGLVWDEVAV